METPPSLSSSPESENALPNSIRMFESYQPIQVSLIDEANLWAQFSMLGTEMVVTRCGRQMFPCVKLRVENLSPYKFYKLYMEFAPTDSMRYRYDKNSWSPKGAQNMVTSSWIEHPYSPAEGFKWMQKPIEFPVKLSNCSSSRNADTAYLRSMHKYMIIIHVEEGSDMTQRNPELTRTFPLVKTTFIAVTTYQNPDVRELKTATNIHAKGIRQKKIKQFQEIYNSERESFPNVESDNAMGPVKRLRLDPNSSCFNSNGSYFPRNYTATQEKSPPTSLLSNWNDTYPKPPNFCSKNSMFTTDLYPTYHRSKASISERIPVTAPLTVHCPSPYVSWDHSPYYNSFAFPLFSHHESFPLYRPLPTTPTLYPGNLPMFQNTCKFDAYRCTSLNICPSCKDGVQNCVTCSDSRKIQTVNPYAPSSTTESDISSTFENPFNGHSSALPLTDCTVSSVSDKNLSESSTETNDVSSSIAEAISLQISD